ncbi:IclR family transcriptional regulator [Streptosporangium sp. NBC_01639]|uniref:IclR family transcriptional regulator n=1 Tax=unclassified Streptosporangium TaxID=2632669 RepID=UPI002DDAB82A|nr:IclR family transcriptional regulator [Streptosporangium sp. NBC_01756]WSC84439.1 IclR family transcriptional regulator [Streptosporangium sp. NBC_01756]WTD56935.1 IclR family transcriptional regulator [Streptosporangium sp. NBC_01639]
MDARPPVKSADRTVALLEALARADRRLTLAELQRELGYPKSSLSMLLRTLAGRGWVECDPAGSAYGIGVRALLVGTSYLDRDPVVRAAALVLEQVRGEINETVHLARLDGADMVYLVSRESQHHLRFSSRVGRRQPAHATALGRAVLSERPDAAELMPPVLLPITPHTVTDRDLLLSELKQARERGYASEREQNVPGLGCFAVALPYRLPVTDAISASIPLVRLDEAHQEHIVATLVRAARQITDLLRNRAV